MMIQPKNGRHRKVSMVVIGIDDFSNKIIQDNFLQVWVPHQAPPVWKAAGYYVFLNLPAEVMSVRLRSPAFHPVEIQADLRQQTEEPPVFSVRLYPNDTYPFPKDVTLVQGTAPAGSLVQVLGSDFPSVKLVEDYRAGSEQIRLFQPEGLCLDEKCFEIFSKDGSDAEQFTVKQQIEGEMFSYSLKQPLQKNYVKGLTGIRPVAQTYTSQDGTYLVPIYCKHSQQICCECMADGKKMQQLCSVTEKKLTVDFV